MIKLNNYFFDVEDIEFDPKEVGSENESWNGINHSNYVSRYLTIDVTIPQLTPSRHSQLLYLVDLNRDNSTESQHLVFSNLGTDEYLNGQEILVDIPLNSFSFERNKGEETYTWDLTLRETNTRQDSRE